MAASSCRFVVSSSCLLLNQPLHPFFPAVTAIDLAIDLHSTSQICKGKTLLVNENGEEEDEEEAKEAEAPAKLKKKKQLLFLYFSELFFLVFFYFARCKRKKHRLLQKTRVAGLFVVPLPIA
ncbi:hypothetical protein LINPERHAP2_LOCUS38517 [Linum perenne]